ncbi:MBL fold metallo-hydrolase [Aurantimicrobium minutum]|uniref:MBL fold metallo-hydrolase n=1 Tax=Aurantimicrobium minutum TaxID=708131 RepID=UPI002473C0DE|nr:MBL fold metallo-hydrolase [Aurantimicrobium minutum]MDH6239908.1 hydroxyacylglutathione hydrolase [Aurantimicrobium minutum]
MAHEVDVYPLISPWGRFGLYSYFIDSPEPAIIDTGITTSPSEGMAPALEEIGRRIQDVKWIFLTHGHIDHLGGAMALWELTGRQAQVVLHSADAHLLRSRQAHVELYKAVRQQYLDNPHAIEEQTQAANFAISGEFEPTMLVSGGETISLGDDVTISVHNIPGHTAGSVAYVLDGQNDVFVGDAVQIHGAANFFPGYEDPVAYRNSLEYLRAQVHPRRLFMGHPYRGSDGESYGVELDAEAAQRALTESLEIEQQISTAVNAALAAGLVETNSPYSPFESVAQELGYTADPTLEPSPFFTTLHGYRELYGK